jgi:predicted nucleic acid-binding protein
VDTSALIALYLPSDKYHRAAAAHLRESARTGGRFVIGRPVLVEYLDGLTKRVSKREAIEQLQFIEASAVMRVERDTEEDHGRARELFLRYDDQSVDMTDALSFSIMERLRIHEAFTFDDDFVVQGLTRMPKG